MLKIQVHGKGLIPRGYGLAPRLTPFNADKNLITTILRTPSLSMKYLNPKDNRFYDLTRENYRRIWDKFGSGKLYVDDTTTVEDKSNTSPHVPGANQPTATAGSTDGTKADSKSGYVPVINTAQETNTTVNDNKAASDTEVDSTDAVIVKPINNSDEQKKDNGSQNNQNKNNNNNNNNNHKK